MVWLVGALLLLWLAWGPVVLLVAAAALCVPRVRWWARDRAYVSRRGAARLAGAAALLAAAVMAVPDGWLPIPPAPGVWAGPSYVGRPAVPSPVAAAPTRNPHLAAEDPADRPGPLGRQPEVATAWYGLERCGRLEVTSADRLVALCTGRGGQSLRVVDPDSLRPTATHELPERPEDSACPGDVVYLDAADRAVVAAGDRQVLAVRTASKGEPDLAPDATWDLKPYVPYGDCLVALAPGWSGRVWWATRAGLVGTLDPASGQVGVADLGEQVRRGIATDEAGAYVVTDEALHRLVAAEDGTPQPVWRTAYTGSSGSAPVLLDGGAVAITDEADDRLGVLFLARDDGRELCRQPVFDDGGSTGSDLAALGGGVVVTNDGGYASPRRTLLGFTPAPGVARVDLADGGCVVAWTSDAVSPGSGAVASRPNGLVYAWTKRPSLTGVSAWYLTAIDASSGRAMWGVRTGTGLLARSGGSRITLGRDGSAFVGTAAGLVRVRDRS
ncbi:PQQ-binding-like beta-propeller repeat protein [Nocardioides xinjiangensis]|uniref:hypothetical protein n=1 Tax=Nocardioides xinjiangensis TaxID=2817376 RepID=UPI001B301979|nr:hypothetical protein [Nocardioides sp. SYSU D00778]